MNIRKIRKHFLKLSGHNLRINKYYTMESVMISNKLNKVLCVNDNEITLFVLKRTLSKANFTDKVVEKRDGLEALKYCQLLLKNPDELEQEYPRLIFLDLHMPLMDGWQFLEQFSNSILPHFKETKVVITSQSVDLSEVSRAKDFPFVIDFLQNTMTVEYLNHLREELLLEA